MCAVSSTWNKHGCRPTDRKPLSFEPEAAKRTRRMSHVREMSGTFKDVFRVVSFWLKIDEVLQEQKGFGDL